jgi:zinc transport system substrate-binding protein
MLMNVSHRTSPRVALVSLVGGALLVGLSACSEPTGAEPVQLDGRVLTTFFPLESMATVIAGDAVEVRCPLPEGADPQFHKPTRAELALYQRASLVLTNGAGFERWLASASLPPSRVVDTASNFTEPLIEHTGMTHSHGFEGGHSHAGTDGHYWLDPLLAREQARRCAQAMSRAFPEHAEVFAAGLARLEADLNGLHERFAAAVPPGTRLIASHPAYDYLARRYGWKVHSLDLDPKAPLSEEQFAELERVQGSLEPALILWESEALPATRESLESRLGLRSVVFSPAENPSAAQRAQGATFLDILVANLQALEAALDEE